MGNCDLTGGRLNDECLDERAGIKTVFFFKHRKLNVEKNLAGEIISIGSGTVFRFEQDENHGLAVQEINRGSEESTFVMQQTDLTLFYITPEFLYTIDRLKAGLWAIFWMDYQGKIRLFGEKTPMYQLGGVDQSGVTASDNRWSNLSFEGISNNYASYLEQFTKYPFDNMPGIIVSPRYDNEPGLLTHNDAGEYYDVDSFGNRLDHN